MSEKFRTTATNPLPEKSVGQDKEKGMQEHIVKGGMSTEEVAQQQLLETLKEMQRLPEKDRVPLNIIKRKG